MFEDERDLVLVRTALKYAKRVIRKELHGLLESYCAFDEKTGGCTDESHMGQREAKDVKEHRLAIRKIEAAQDILK